jgi:hypothetical protein
MVLARAAPSALLTLPEQNRQAQEAVAPNGVLTHLPGAIGLRTRTVDVEDVFSDPAIRDAVGDNWRPRPA